MDAKTFDLTIERTIKKSTDVLLTKQREYATEDRLHNFKVAAGYLQRTPEQALMGFLAKHLVSLSDMVRSGAEYNKDVWDEKIGDSINYLLLLRALVDDK